MLTFKKYSSIENASTRDYLQKIKIELSPALEPHPARGPRDYHGLRAQQRPPAPVPAGGGGRGPGRCAAPAFYAMERK